MKQKLSVFLTKQQKEAMDPVFIELNFADGWYDFLRNKIIGSSIRAKQIIEEFIQTSPLHRKKGA